MDNGGPSLENHDLFNPRWTHSSFMDKVTGGDITKYKEAYRCNYVETLDLLAYKHEIDLYKEDLRRRDEIRNNIR